MEDDSDAAQPVEGTQASEDGAEAEELAGKVTLEGTDLPDEGAHDSAKPSEATRGGEGPEETVQETETSTSLNLPEPSKEATDVDSSTKETAKEEGEATAPPQDGKASAEKLHEAPSDGGMTEGEAPGEKASKEKDHKPKEAEERDSMEPGEAQENSRSPGPGMMTASAEEARRLKHQEHEGRSQGEVASLRAPSTTGEGGLSRPTEEVVHGGERQAVALRSQEPLSEDERSSRETAGKTSRGGRSLSKSEAALSSTTPAEEESESVVSSALPGMIFEEEDRPLSEHPLSLCWVFGYNSKLPVFNLLDEDFRVILYVSGHTAVIHDILRNRQYLLQGHSSCISCICVSDDRRWVVTADRGPDSLVIVWDSYSAVPVHTIFDSHPEGGVSAVAISRDSKFLATVGAGEVQKISIWRWTSPDTSPVCSVEILPQYGFQDYVVFNSKDHQELMSNSETQVVFYKWDSSALRYQAPLLTEKTFDKVVGSFSQSLFHFRAPQAMTATMEGKLVVWEPVGPPPRAPAASAKPYNMKAVKLVHLQKDGITALAVMDRNFVTCDVKGHVKFYDGDLQLLHWYSQFKIGAIRSISFSKNPACPQDVTKFPTSCTLSGLPFVVRNFILATTDALVIHVKTEGMTISKCLEEPKGAVYAIDCHPRKPLMAKGSSCGLLKVWNYKLNKYLVSRIFKGQSIRSLCYNHDGSLLAVGFTDGTLRILDSISLDEECTEPFDYSRGPITLMSFSHNSQYLATADENISVNLYKQILVERRKVWERLAALHAHYKPIRTILFGVHLDSHEPRLLSLGEDRLLVEYDLQNSVKDELVILRKDRIEQSAVPKSITWYPPLTMEHFFLTANDQYKMKMYNATTKLCRKTVLGPAYGSPLEKMLVLPVSPGHDPQKRYLAYMTKDKVGLQILPIDGNPHKSSAFICHPAGVSNLACSFDGHYLFTAGGNDLTVMKWDINLSALEAAVFLGGTELIPFYNLLDGGREGDFFKELEDYFYYAQLCHQGIDTMEPRKVSTHIPLEQIPFVMRAMGFYPSEEQIEDMLNEVKFSEYLESGKQVTDINLGDFIKLYVNHRPAFGLAAKEIENAFRILGYENENHQLTIHRDDLLLLLQHRGEHLTEDELAEHLTTLLGVNPEGGRSEAGTYDPTGADAFIEEEIPEEITAAHFTTEILGLPVPEPTSTEGETTHEPTSSNLSSES
uniref:Cilia- and flagella-associated protein 251 n=1 Tax=Pogona vitticeps TaxID=103695 RepID=A0A6J0UK01_9SAUR